MRGPLSVHWEASLHHGSILLGLLPVGRGMRDCTDEVRMSPVLPSLLGSCGRHLLISVLCCLIITELPWRRERWWQPFALTNMVGSTVVDSMAYSNAAGDIATAQPPSDVKRERATHQ